MHNTIDTTSSHQETHPGNTGDWDILIAPKNSLFQLNLAELWRYRDLIGLLVKRDFVARYKQTVLGPVWHFIQPLLTTVMSVLIFNMVAGLDPDGKPALLFQMTGIVAWNYFAACLTGTANTFTANAAIFGKVYFPRLAIPLSVVVSNLVQLGIQCLLLLATLLYFVAMGRFSIPWGANLLVLPVVVIMMAGTGLGLGIIISSLTTKYRDFQVLVTFGVQLLMYGSAVNYSLASLQAKGGGSQAAKLLLGFVQWNPLSNLIEGFRNIVLGGPVPYSMLGYSAAFMAVALLLGVILFNKVEKTFMDTV